MADNDSESTRLHDPAYGQLNISRVSSSNSRLFGSDLTHHSFICVRVNEASIERAYNQDRIFGDKHIIEIYLTEDQFRTAVSTPNHGAGVPCTIRYRQDMGLIDYTPLEPQEKLVDAEVEERFKSLVKHMEKLEQMVGNAKMTAKDRAAIMGEIFTVKQEMSSNLPWILTQFKRTLVNMMTEAKTAVEAFATTYLTGVGMSSLQAKKSLPGLTSSEDHDTGHDAIEGEFTNNEHKEHQ